MAETKSNRVVRRGRIFPEIQWSEERKAQWQAESKAFRQRCEVIFKRVQPELIKTHYNWYIAVEPESGDYFIDKNEILIGRQWLKSRRLVVDMLSGILTLGNG